MPTIRHNLRAKPTLDSLTDEELHKVANACRLALRDIRDAPDHESEHLTPEYFIRRLHEIDAMLLRRRETT